MVEPIARIREAVGAPTGVDVGLLRLQANCLAALVREQALTHREELLGIVERLERTGFPPSFVHVAGASDLEKPFNRLLAWWTDDDAEHGLARAFVGDLARTLGFSELAEDVLAEAPEVQAETGYGVSGRAPDLLLRTRRAALLLENKVNAPESGPTQYSHYLEILESWAKDGIWKLENRKRKAILCARGSREVPEGWDGFLAHSELAAIFRRVAASPTASAWGRVSAIVTGVAFDADDDYGEPWARARKILKATRGRAPRPREGSEIRQLIARLKEIAVPHPWKER